MRKLFAGVFVFGLWTGACGSSAMSEASGNDGDTDAAPAGQMGDAHALTPSTTDSSDGTPLDGMADASVASACDAMAQAYCSQYSSCAALTFGLYYQDVAQCEDRFANLYCAVELAAPGTGATPDRWLACAAATAQQSCEEWLAGPPAPCAVAGTAAEGASCEFDSQCASEFCARATGEWCGTCQSAPVLGQVCDPNAPACGPGQACADVGCSVPIPDGGYCTGTRMWSCVAPVPPGGPCVTPAQCEDQMACLAGTCAAPKQLGEACLVGDNTCTESPALECLATGASGAYVCTAITFASAGQACAPENGAFCAGGSCRNASGAAVDVGGLCALPAADGQPCGDTGCLTPSLCIKGTCQPPVPGTMCQ